LWEHLQDAARIVSARVLDTMKKTTPIAYHVLVVTVSAGIALSLPITVAAFSQTFLAFWAHIEHEKVFLVSIEVAVAISLILLVNLVRECLKDRRLAKTARGAGLIHYFPAQGRLLRKRAGRLKQKQGIARSVMIIGSTGYRTLVEPPAELRPILENCLEAKIMLLNPDSLGARSRAMAIADPHITPEYLRDQLRRTIEFLKELKDAQKNIKLKLYADPPHLKLAILGDYIWLRHYHTNLDVRMMPEYVFQHTQNEQGLYTLFYQYFMRRWENPDIPEYDLETDEIIYRGEAGAIRREPTLRPTPSRLPYGKEGLDSLEAGISWS
jgi:hypothetical protein